MMLVDLVAGTLPQGHKYSVNLEQGSVRNQVQRVWGKIDEKEEILGG
jgi:hypothetical protein